MDPNQHTADMPVLKYSEVSSGSLGNLSRTSSEQDVQTENVLLQDDIHKLENLCQTYQERIQTLESELYLLVTGDTSQTFSLKQLRARNADWKRRSPGQQDLKLPALWEERLNKIGIHVFEGELFKLRQEIERLINQSDNVPQSVDKVDNIITAELQRIRLLATVAPTLSSGSAVAFEAVLKGYSTLKDAQFIKELCLQLNQGSWEELYSCFYRAVIYYRDHKPGDMVERDSALEREWYKDAWYYTYVQYFGTKDMSSRATFDDLIEMLPYLEYLGFRNLYLLPHYESPLADGGYDVSAYRARQNLGGHEAYLRFMKAALAKGFRVATDAIFNHTSTEHSWFRKARQNKKKYIEYYLKRNGRKKIGEYERDGDIICQYQDPDQTISERICIFPDVDRTHGLLVTTKDQTIQFYRSFYPFQVDLDLRNVAVLEEIFHILGNEMNEGILGKRMDAIAHWIKKPGTLSDSLKETHVLHALLKSYLKHVSPQSIVIPEVVRNSSKIAAFAGEEIELIGQRCSSEGDLLMAFEMQARLREMNYLQTVAPFWQQIFALPRLPCHVDWLNLLEHHDETYMGFFSVETRHILSSYIEEHGGVVYKNHMSAGCRYANCLENDLERVATAIFTLYMTPGTPLIYYGLEIGWQNNNKHAEYSQKWQKQTFQKFELDISEEKCYDPRELQRGPIPKSKFEMAWKQQLPTVVIVQKLNQLRKQRRSLASNSEIYPVDSGHVSLLSMVRQGIGDVPLLCVANLSSNKMCLTIPSWQLKEYLKVTDIMNISTIDILTGVAVILIKQENVHLLDMPPYSRAILQVEQSWEYQ
eukprot:jgi/Galph1/201/GphlegSOOS_G4997.1